ncbi:MAG: DUF1800 domain-containing protein [Planctomycetota bacterium]|jgi:uncharacterized protein (DUF1800 family)
MSRSARELLEPFRPGQDGPWDRATAAHLLRRAQLGVAPDVLEAALAGTPAQAVEAVLATSRAADPTAVRRTLTTGELRFVQADWAARLCTPSAHSLNERLALMWHGHFATSDAKVDDVRLMFGQLETLRTLGAGDFRELLGAIAVDPAMLIWLDGVENRAKAPNENLARELFELFGLGIGHYTEHDIQEAARALSGWTVRGRQARFDPRRHDAGEKRVFGKSVADVDDVVAGVLEHPACSRWIARRLLSTFVGLPEDAALEAELAERLVSADWRIDALLEQLLGSRLMLSSELRRPRVGSPVEYLARVGFGLGVRLKPTEAVEHLARMGQDLLRPPTVEGWKGGRTWISPSSWIARERCAAALAERWEALAPERGLDEDLDAWLAALMPGQAAPSWADELRGEAQSTTMAHARGEWMTLLLASPEIHLS